MSKPLYQQLASLFIAWQNCQTSKFHRPDAVDNHREMMTTLVKRYMPSGSGFDVGTAIDLDRTTPECLVFHTSFHPMDEHGFYENWLDFTVTVRPSLAYHIDLEIEGRDRNDIKGYVDEVFHLCLVEPVDTTELQREIWGKPETTV